MANSVKSCTGFGTTVSVVYSDVSVSAVGAEISDTRFYRIDNGSKAQNNNFSIVKYNHQLPTSLCLQKRNINKLGKGVVFRFS